MKRIHKTAILINRLAIMSVISIMGLISCTHLPKVEVISSVLRNEVYTRTIVVQQAFPTDTNMSAIITDEIIPYVKESHSSYKLFEVKVRDSNYIITAFDPANKYLGEPDIYASYINGNLKFLIHASALPVFSIRKNTSDTISYMYTENEWISDFEFEPIEWTFKRTAHGYELEELFDA